MLLELEMTLSVEYKLVAHRLLMFCKLQANSLGRRPVKFLVRLDFMKMRHENAIRFLLVVEVGYRMQESPGYPPTPR